MWRRFTPSDSKFHHHAPRLQVAAVCEWVFNVPRSSGRRRSRAWRGDRMIMRSLGRDHDVVLVHDPELVLAAAGLGLTNLIWDVHEDPAAALRVKSWMPAILRLPGSRNLASRRVASGTQALPIVGRTRLSAEVPQAASRGCQLGVGPEGRGSSGR